MGLPIHKKASRFGAKVLAILCALIVLPAAASAAANMSIVPVIGTYQVGDIVTVRATISSDASLNAISSKIHVPTDYFSIQSVTKAGSILDFWVTEPTFNFISGIVDLEGVALSGFRGSGGTVISIRLKAIKVGTGKITFQTSQVLANDGEGTNITGSLIGQDFTISAAPVVVPVEPKPAPVPTPAPTPTPEPEEPLEPPQPAPTLEAPEIMSGTKYGAQSITGSSAYPRAQVLITFLSRDGGKVLITGMTDADGSFNVTVPSSLKHGDYKVSAILVKEDKSNSETSNTIIIGVGSIISDTDPWVLGALAVLLGTILALLARAHRAVAGNTTVIRKRIREKAHKAEDVAHKAFDILRDDMAEERKPVRATRRKKTIADIEKDISAVEKIVEKEIKEIGST